MSGYVSPLRIDIRVQGYSSLLSLSLEILMFNVYTCVNDSNGDIFIAHGCAPGFIGSNHVVHPLIAFCISVFFGKGILLIKMVSWENCGVSKL